QTGLQGHLRWRAAVRFKPRLEIAHTDRVLYFGCLTTTVMGVWPCPRVVRRGMCRAPRGGRLFATSAHETRQSKPAPSAETCTGTANPLGIIVRNAALQRSTQNLDSADQLCCTSKLRLNPVRSTSQAGFCAALPSPVERLRR